MKYTVGQNGVNISIIVSRSEDNDLRLYCIIHTWASEIFFLIIHDTISNK